ncbi:glycosyltransferase family 2 protein [Pseudanabaena sp. CCNP1317]|uniref:glycosyltransferase family 2 protein n=1 Tax=Pseudanabaena sp. CCNP1317 TaxID=3110253 RepID=UPI002B209BDA|nr:glycosyltransferase [Pseudanabaena sp. CCNP1317]MEA5487184.1 glycosyltransferase [Pseudanabaena sp. CCNP1317]
MSEFESIPTVSIGLAVYNGEIYLREAIDSLLAQTFTDFELIISDNASTDATADICAEYAAKDTRIHYHRNPTNIGGANNENLTFRLSRGRYFRLAAHDDRCAPQLLARCVDVLDANDDVVLCHTGVVSIDDNGLETQIVYRFEGTEGNPVDRLRSLSGRQHWCEATYGLMRSDILRTTELQKNYTNSDRVLLCELAMHGPFHLVPEPLFYKRYHPGNEYKDWRGRMAWFDPALVVSGKSTFPNWMELFDYFRTIGRTPISTKEQLDCMWVTTKWAFTYRSDLVRDLTSAAKHRFRSGSERRRRYASEETWR